MDRALYDRLGAAAPTAITIAKSHGVSVPALLGAMGAVAEGLASEGETPTDETPEALAAFELLQQHPRLGAESWPAHPSAAELKAAHQAAAERRAEERAKRKAAKAEQAAKEQAELAERKAKALAVAEAERQAFESKRKAERAAKRKAGARTVREAVEVTVETVDVAELAELGTGRKA